MTPTTDCPRTGLVVALLEELRPLSRAIGLHGLPTAPLHSRPDEPPVTALVCGPGWRHAAQAARRLVTELGCQRLLSIGFAGGLLPHLLPGDAVLVEAVHTPPTVDGQDTERDAPWRLRAADAAWLASFDDSGYHRGTALTSDELLPTPEAKRAAAVRSGAAVVDMETGAVAQVAAELGVPWLGVRVISDAVSEPLPTFVVRYFDRQAGGVRLLPMFGYLLPRPACWLQLARLARTTRRAGDRLSEAARRALEATR